MCIWIIPIIDADFLPDCQSLMHDTDIEAT